MEPGRFRHVRDKESLLETLCGSLGASCDVTSKFAMQYIAPRLCPKCRVKLNAPIVRKVIK